MQVEEDILGFKFFTCEEFVITDVQDSVWLESADFKRLSMEKGESSNIIRIANDHLQVHKCCLLEFMRFYNYRKYLQMIENSTDNFFDTRKIIPSSRQDNSVFDIVKKFLI